MSDHWTIDQIPKQNGRLVLITGANSGIGFEAARVLAQKGARIILACRNQEKTQTAMERVRQDSPDAQLEFLPLDLADLASVRKCVAGFQERFDRLDLLINNAGVMIPPYSKTKDGFELQIGVNHLGHFAFTALLFETIRKTPDSRIVIVSSGAHRFGKIDFDDLNWEHKRYVPWQAYGQSKIANLYFMYELVRRLGEKNHPLLAAVHPGYAATNLQQHMGVLRVLNFIMAQSSFRGSLPTLYAGTAADIENGAYYGPDGFREMRGWPIRVESNELSHDPGIANRLWQVSEALTGIPFPV